MIENVQAWDNLLQKFTFIQAAGGFVKNKQGEVLMIYRRGKWDFPKGKVEKNETIEEAAIREVKEETGVSAAIESEQWIRIYHTYTTYGPAMLKETTWYAMYPTSSQILVPQKEEDIEKAVWVPYETVENLLKESYASLQEAWHTMQNLTHSFMQTFKLLCLDDVVFFP